jgi:hypothetical protein
MGSIDVFPSQTGRYLASGSASSSGADYTLNNVAWTNVDTALDILLNGVQVGDVIEVSLNTRWNNENVFGRLDVATIVSGSSVNYFSSGTGTPLGDGIFGWTGQNSLYIYLGAPFRYTLQSGDISSGTVTLRLRYQTATAANKTLVRAPIRFMAQNLGPPSGVVQGVATVVNGLKDFKLATRTSGDLTLNSATWANVDTGLDLTLIAATGDVIEAEVNGLWGIGGVYGALDVATIVGGSVVNYLSSGTSTPRTNGEVQWLDRDSTDGRYNGSSIGGAARYVVQAGDISGGTVTLRLRYTTFSASNKTLSGSTSSPLTFKATNLGQPGAWATLTYPVWAGWTPAIAQSGAVAATVTRARYVRSGTTVTASFYLSVTGSGSAGTGVTISLPLPAASSGFESIGAGWVYDTSTSTRYGGEWTILSTTTIALIGDWSGANTWGLTPNVGLASGDILTGTIVYEAA